MPAQNPENGNNSGQIGRTKWPGLISSVQSKIPVLNKNSRSFLLFITASVLIILIVILFFGFLPSDKTNLQKFLKPQEAKKAQSDFGGFERITESAQKVAEETKSYQAYRTLFGVQRDQYYSDGQENHRKEAEKTIDKAKSLFASDFKNYDFVIACLDDECQVLPYGDSVKDIAADVQAEQGIDQSLLRGTLVSLRVFSYYDNRVPLEVLYGSYEQLFHNLVSIYQFDKSEKIKSDIEKVLLIMKETNPSQFGLLEKLGLYKY